jgi:hypothetical protein
MYSTGGISTLSPVYIVTKVNMQVTNRPTLAGIASSPNQKENHDSETIRKVGI